MPANFLSCRAALCTCAVVLATLCGAPAAWAEKADRDKPMNAEADALRYDDAHQTSVFTGNVVITKGTIIIRGAQVDVRQDEDGNQFGVVQASPDKLAFYRQKREGVDEYIEGEAKRIDYDGKADIVKFIGQAVMRRYRGATLADETRGSLIVYNNKTEIYTVDSGADSKSSGNPSGRVRAMLTPKPQPGTAPAPVTNPTQLQPSGQLGTRP